MSEWLDQLADWQRQLLIVSAIVIGAMIAGFVVRGLAAIVKHHIARRTKTDLDDRLLSAVGRAGYWLIQLYGARILIEYLHGEFVQVPEVFFRTAAGLVYVVIVYVVVRFVYSLTNILQQWYAVTIASRTETRLDDEFLPLFGRAIKTVTVVLAAMAVLSHFQIDIKGLVAVLGVSSLAIALAAQDTLSNMIAGFIIMLDRPFKVGDRVTLPSGDKVDVFEIGLRSTKFKTFENTLVIVPNAELAKSQITNLSYPEPTIRVRVDVGVAYGTDVERVKEIMLDVAASHDEVLDDPAPRAYFLAFGESELAMSMRGRTRSFKQQWRVNEELRCEVYRRFEKAGIEIPFPQRVVHTPSVVAIDSNGPRAETIAKTGKRRTNERDVHGGEE